VDDRNYEINRAVCEILVKIMGKERNPFEQDEELTPGQWLTLRQIACHAADMFACQHRTHLFMVFVAGRTHRLLRWDRDQVPVTESSSDKGALRQFFSLFDTLTPAQRGHDPSVQRVGTHIYVFEIVFLSELERHALQQFRVQQPAPEAFVNNYHKAGCVAIIKLDTFQACTCILSLAPPSSSCNPGPG
jgi:hypothetical protein